LSNRNIVMDENGKVIGEYYASLVCFAIVLKLVEKYNPNRVIDFTCCPDTVNDVLKVVYDRCDPWEEMMLLLFINDNSHFDQDSLPALDKAIQKYDFPNDGPKRHLVFMRELLGKHQSLKTKYMDSTAAITVMKEI